MLRIVHLADLHLDIPFASNGRRSAVSNARREALRQALKRAIAVARDWQAEVVTIGVIFTKPSTCRPTPFNSCASSFRMRRHSALS